MRLKRLELIGFKSFADKSIFEFGHGLTGLVGPNGAGKSNVVDAVKWVLGEQSARNLRGDEMADVIFNGTDSRKAASRAEVRLTIVNDRGLLPVDYEEVCISRQIDRSGQSAYYLNKQQCRLKDIRQVIMGTGLGVRHYSFIEQGQVDHLLRASPQECRQIFEEAAGISRFLAQKREAERKLERVRLNLERVTDIVEEVEKQLRSVKAQAARARRFKRYSDELERLRIAQALHGRRELQGRSDAHASALTALEEEIGQVEGAVRDGNSRLEGERRRLEQARAEKAAAEQKLTGLETRRFGIEREIALNTRRIEETTQREQESSRRAAELEEKVQTLKSELDEATTSLQNCQDELEQARRSQLGKRSEAEDLQSRCADLSREVENEKAEVFELLRQESQVQNEIAVLESEKKALAHRLERQNSRRRQVRENLDKTRTLMAEKQQQVQAARDSLQRVTQSLARLENESKRQIGDLERLAGRAAELNAQLSGKTGRKDLLEDLQARAEGIGGGTRLLLGGDDAEGEAEGALGMLADLVEVDMKYAPAVEAALAHRVQAVVFRSRTQAGEAMLLLKKSNTGRAEIIPLDHVAGPAPSTAPLTDSPPILGRLHEFVRCSNEMRAVVESVLSHTVLVADMDGALAVLSDGMPIGTKIVTLDGECLEVGGFWSGGGPQEGSLITRKSELNLLGEQIDKLQETIESLLQRKDEISRRTEVLRKQQRELEAERDGLVLKQNDLQSQVRIIENQREQLAEEIKLADQEEESVRKDMQTLTLRREEVCCAQEQLRSTRAARQGRVEQLKEELDRADRAREQAAEEVASLSSTLARLEEQHGNLRALLSRVRQDLELRRQELQQTEQQRISAQALRAEAEAAVQAARAESEALQQEKARQQTHLKENEAACGELSRQLEDMAAKLQTLRAQRDELRERQNELRLKQNETRLSMENLHERIRDTFGVRLDALELAPEQWREHPLFENRVIDEFVETETDDEPEPVAAWFGELEEQAAAEDDEQTRPDVISLEEAADYRAAIASIADSAETDWREIERRANELKRKVDGIGSVNLDAIRQQDELDIRAQFLRDQKEDLEKARRHEMRIIGELNKTSRQRFAETFEAVRENFQALFRKLFQGGKADLILDQEAEDILEAGIQIVARPPGKELLPISLLSGGEKAMTTVALLFAIFKTKPSPFCLLDEVDAPLDETNIERFVALVREFTGDTQFIIVTHNKLTMSIADVLYGVSLDERGTSRKVQVNFAEVEHELAEMDRQAEAARRRAG